MQRAAARPPPPRRTGPRARAAAGSPARPRQGQGPAVELVGASGRSRRRPRPRRRAASSERKRLAQQLIDRVVVERALRRPSGGPITTTTSPLGGPAGGVGRGQLGQACRAGCSSCSLVSSRATRPRADPAPPRHPRSISARRCADSNRTSVAGTAASSSSTRRRPRGARRQEALEQEPVGRQAGGDQRRQRRRGARDRVDGAALGRRLAHQLEAGIGDRGRAGVADQRHRSPAAQPGQQLRPGRGRVVLVVEPERPAQARDAAAAGWSPAGPRRRRCRRWPAPARPGASDPRDCRSASPRDKGPGASLRAAGVSLGSAWFNMLRSGGRHAAICRPGEVARALSSQAQSDCPAACRRLCRP